MQYFFYVEFSFHCGAGGLAKDCNQQQYNKEGVTKIFAFWPCVTRIRDSVTFSAKENRRESVYDFRFYISITESLPRTKKCQSCTVIDNLWKWILKHFSLERTKEKPWSGLYSTPWERFNTTLNLFFFLQLQSAFKLLIPGLITWRGYSVGVLGSI